jgi:hypothetical protein
MTRPLEELLSTSELSSLKDIAAGSERPIPPAHIGVLLQLKLIEEGPSGISLTAAGERRVNTKPAEQ